MPSMRLTVTRMAEEMTGAIVEDQDIRGGPVIADLAYDVGDDLRRACGEFGTSRGGAFDGSLEPLPVGQVS